MNGFLDIYTILFLVLAVVVFLRLRSVLGRRTGHERPPFDPYTRPDGPPGEKAAGDREKVVPLPRKPSDASGGTPSNANRWKEYDRPGTTLVRDFNAMANIDPSFDPGKFLEGAKTAYEMTVTAFASGDRKTLQSLLSPEVFEGFVEAITSREGRGESVETTFIGLDKAEFVDTGLKGATAQLTIRFISQLITVTRDKDGKVVEGDEKTIHEVTDIWTFSRDLTSSDPNWKLVATEAAV